MKLNPNIIFELECREYGFVKKYFNPQYQLKYIPTLLSLLSKGCMNTDDILPFLIWRRDLNVLSVDGELEINARSFISEDMVINSKLYSEIARLTINEQIIADLKSELDESSLILNIGINSVFKNSSSVFDILADYLRELMKDSKIYVLKEVDIGLIRYNLFRLKQDLESLINTLKTLENRVGGVIFLDAFDSYTASKLVGNQGFIKTLSKIIMEIFESGDVYIKSAPRMKIAILKPCNSMLLRDLEIYLEILDNIPTISYHIIDECIEVGYLPLLSLEDSALFLRRFLKATLGSNIRTSIIVTSDPMLYHALFKAAYKFPVIVGYLPTLLLHFIERLI